MKIWGITTEGFYFKADISNHVAFPLQDKKQNKTKTKEPG